MTSFDDAPRFWEVVQADARAAGGGRRSPFFYLAAGMGLNKFSVILLFRIAASLRQKGWLGSKIAASVTRWNVILNSCEFSPDARIGPGLAIPHPIGVGFGPITAGRNFTILQHASLGLRNRKLDHGDAANYPTVGDDVEIGPCAAVLGPVRLGDGAVVGANAVVLQDVPSGGIAVGNPARIIERKPKPGGST